MSFFSGKLLDEYVHTQKLGPLTVIGFEPYDLVINNDKMYEIGNQSHR